MQRICNVVLAFAFVISPLFFCGCSDDQLGMRTFSQAHESPDPAVLMFFVDGIDRSCFNTLIGEGKLPNIEKLFVKGGAGVTNAVTSIPSVTYPNATSFITGCFPGHHGILGNQWFDREEYFLRNYSTVATYQSSNDDFENPTLFEVLDDKLTVNVRFHTRRGATKSYDRALGVGIDWLLNRYEQADEQVGLSAPAVVNYARAANRWPAVYLSYFPGLDAIGHLYGSDSAEYERGLITVDQAIGRIVEDVRKSHPDLNPYYVLTTDHSHVPENPEKFADVCTWLKNSSKLRIHQGDGQGSIRSWRKAQFDRSDMVIVNGAYRRVAIHLKGKDGWQQRPSADAVEHLIRPDESGLCGGMPGILLASIREDKNHVRVLTHHNAYKIERHEELGQKKYRVIEQSTPGARLANSKLSDVTETADRLLRDWADGQWRSSHEWLNMTATTEMPDFVPQMVEYFDSVRAGDVIFFADGDWSFYNIEKGGHGSCLAADMRIPMYFAGPDIPAGSEIPAARLVDVMPTVLDMLGELKRLDNQPRIDGISLLPKLRGAARP